MTSISWKRGEEGEGEGEEEEKGEEGRVKEGLMRRREHSEILRPFLCGERKVRKKIDFFLTINVNIFVGNLNNIHKYSFCFSL